MTLDGFLGTSERRLTSTALVQRVARLLNDTLLLVYAFLKLLLNSTKTNPCDTIEDRSKEIL